MFKFKINGTTVTDPLEWADFTETLEYDSEVYGILMKYNQKFTFIKDGYEAISNALASNGYCQRLPLQVLYSCTGGPDEIVLDGFIFLTEAKFNRSKCTVEVEFEDNSYTGKIYANRLVNAFINSDRSKNGVTIVPATKFFITMFDPVGTIPNFTRPVYDLKDTFRYLIDFMTDGAVGFVSDWLDNLDDDKHIAISSGSLFRYIASIHEEPNISFQELFEEIRKKFNIAFALEKDSSGNPQIRIEEFDYFKNNVNQSISINNIPELMQSFDSDSFYSQVKIGSNAIPFVLNKFALYPIPFITHQKESYFVQGECNTDEELNLVSDWIIDSNIIQGLTLSDILNTDYDKNHLFIQYTASTLSATKWNTIDNTIYPNRWYYNEIFTNALVADRFNLQGDIAKYLGVAVPLFAAGKTTASPTQTHIGISSSSSFGDVFTDLEYSDDSTPPFQDPGLNYNNTTYRFKAPATGLYTFYQSWSIEVTRNDITVTAPFGVNKYHGWKINFLDYNFRKYSVSGTFIADFGQSKILDLFKQAPTNVGIYSFNETQSIFLQANEQVSVKATIRGDYYTTTVPPVLNNVLEYNIAASGMFSLVTANTGGGIYGTSKDPNTYYTSIYEFEQVLTEAEWTAIRNNPQNYLRFSMDNNNGQKGWLRKMERNKATGLTKFTLVSNLENQ